MWPIILISRIHKGTDNTHLPARFGPNQPSSCWEIGDREKKSDMQRALFIWWCKWPVVLIFEIHSSAWCIQSHVKSSKLAQRLLSKKHSKRDTRTHVHTDSPILILWCLRSLYRVVLNTHTRIIINTQVFIRMSALTLLCCAKNTYTHYHQHTSIY